MTTQTKKGPKLSISQRLAEKKENLSNAFEKFRTDHPDDAQNGETREDLSLLSLDEIQSRIHGGKTSPKELLVAFQNKCATLNLSVSGLIDQANELAEELSITQHSKPRTARAPLFGIPVSVDEIHLVSGQDCTLGLGKLCGETSTEDCVLIKVLKEEGVIPFVQTANPQGLLYPDSHNSVVGELSNPFSNAHVAGAGSSGEAVLLAQRGSPIGFGSDLTGGLRLSAAFCELAGLKPSSRRIGNLGMKQFTPNPFVLMPNVPGPMGHKVNHLADALRTVLRPALFRLDTFVPPLSFHEQLFTGTDKPHLTIGYYDTLTDPGILETVPSVRNAVQRAVSALKNRGHDCQPFQPPDIFHAFEISIEALYSNATEWRKKMLSGEPIDEEVKQTHKMLQLSQLRRITSQAFGRKALRSRAAPKMKRPSDVHHLVEEIQAYRNNFVNAMVEASNMDIIIGPIWTSPAPSKDCPPKFKVLSLVYSLIYNMLDVPAGVVPAGCVNEIDLEITKQELEARKGDHCFAELLELQQKSLGLPIGVQVIGKPYHEEVVLRVMHELEEEIRAKSSITET